MAILDPVNGNNGLSDNIIEYIFAKRSHQIALFLADRIYRFYIQDTPTRSELDSMAAIILANNFEMLPSIRSILSLDLMYSDTAMNAIRYKNPLELYVGTLKRIRDNNMTGMLRDPNLYDTSILRRLNWSPYFPGSVFGRDGFDDSRKWNNAGIQNGWMNITNYFTYRTTGTGVIDYRLPLGDYRKILTTETVPVMTNISNVYSGILILQSATFTIDSVS